MKFIGHNIWAIVLASFAISFVLTNLFLSSPETGMAKVIVLYVLAFVFGVASWYYFKTEH